MGPQRRSSDTPQPPDAPAAPPLATQSPPQSPANPAAGFHVTGKDAFRDQAERKARKRAEQAVRRREVAAASTAPPSVVENPAPRQPLKLEPRVISPAPTRPAAPAVASEPERRTAAIIPWPGRVRVTGPLAASTDAPPAERPPEVDTPKPDPKPAPAAGATPASAPFSAADFGGGEEKGGGGGGKGGGSGTGGEQKRKRFNQDDIAGGVIVLLVLILIGWMGVNLVGKQPGDDRLLKPQSAAIAPAPQPPAVKPDPFPPGPIDLKPKSPMPEAQPTPAPETKQALAAPPVTTEPVVTAQAAPSPPTPAVQPAGASCAPGRMIHAYFCTSHSDLTPAARTALDAAVAGWRSCAAGQELAVKGYADTRGAAEINAALGANRAKALADILRSQGLKVSEVDGVGELQGLEDGQNCANQRRVDVGLKSEIEKATPSRACRPPKEVAPLGCGPAAPKLIADAPTPAR